MANNLLIGLTNLLAGATLKNGTGGGAPARNEASPYVMENAQGTDRSSAWATSAAPDVPQYIDFDLGSSKAITVFAILGFRASTISAVTAMSAYTSGGAVYPPVGWTFRGGLNVARDTALIIGSVSQRYVRFQFDLPLAAFSVGRLWVGSPTDIGVYHDTDGVYGVSRNRMETQLPGGAFVLTDLGDPGGRYSLRFSTADATLKNTLKGLRDQSGSFVVIDPEGQVREVFVPGGQVEPIRRWNSVWDVPLELTVMP